MPLTPLHEDAIVTTAAAALECYVIRRRSVRVSNAAAVKAAGFVRASIDYSKLRKMLEDGVPVEGAELGDYEYVLCRSESEPE